MGTRGCVIAIMIVGCGSGGGGTADAPHGPDAPIDAPNVAPPDARPPVPGAFVLSQAQVPTSSAEIQMLGLDLDGDQPGGDAGVDNQLGAVLSAFASMGYPIQTTVSAGVDRGASLTLFYFDPVTADLETYAGTNPDPPACASPSDTTCRHHLDGHGLFDLAPGVPAGTMPTTTVTTTVGGPGTATIELAIFSDDDPIPVQLIGARFVGTAAGSGITDAKLAGAITFEGINDGLIPALGNQLRASIATDCPTAVPPDCTCAAGSPGETAIATFDDDHDCAVTDNELRMNTLVQALFMTDVTIDGIDGLSFGFGVTAVPAAFNPP